MHQLTPVPFRPGVTSVEVPRDAEPRGVVVTPNGALLMVEVNVLTAHTVPKVTWQIHGVVVGAPGEIGRAPAKAEYVDCAFVDGEGAGVVIACYVEKAVILTPSSVGMPAGAMP